MLFRMLLSGTIGTAPRWNPADKDSKIVLSNSDATATRNTTSNGTWALVRGLTARSTGKWYAELRDDADGSLNGSLIFGAATSAASLTNFLGSDANGYGIQANNTTNLTTYKSGVASSQGNGTNSITAGGIAMVAYDADAGKIWLGSNGVWINSGNPGAGTGQRYNLTANTVLYLALSEFSNPQQCTLKNAVGENTYAIPAGFSMWE